MAENMAALDHDKLAKLVANEPDGDFTSGSYLGKLKSKKRARSDSSEGIEKLTAPERIELFEKSVHPHD